MAQAPRKKRITIKDIAQMAGTSKTTVSFYLNGHTNRMSEDTRQRISDAIEQTGYEPNPLARGMNAKTSRLIGVVIGDVTNEFSNRIVKGIDSIASQEGYRLLICSSNYSTDNESAYIDRLLALGVDGFIVQPTAQFKAIAENIEAAGKKLVFFDSKFYDYASNWVKTDNYEAAYSTIERCVEQGYQRFLLVAAAPQLLSSRIERFSGFVDALEKEHLGFSQFEISPQNTDVDGIRDFLREGIDGSTPTLVFAPNCWALPDVYVAMREFYPLMPETVGLVGFDNFDWTNVASPSVTSIEQPAFEEGREACRILIDLLANEDRENVHQVLSCNVRWRGTTR